MHVHVEYMSLAYLGYVKCLAKPVACCSVYQNPDFLKVVVGFTNFFVNSDDWCKEALLQVAQDWLRKIRVHLHIIYTTDEGHGVHTCPHHASMWQVQRLSCRDQAVLKQHHDNMSKSHVCHAQQPLLLLGNVKLMSPSHLDQLGIIVIGSLLQNVLFFIFKIHFKSASTCMQVSAVCVCIYV